jgi:hypothetical protein
MNIELRLSDRQATASLLDFFQRRDMPARLVGDDGLVVELPEEMQERAGRHEIELLLRVWQLMNPDVRVDVN